MAVLLLNACDNAVENKTADGNTGGGETLPPKPKPKFAVTYTGIYAITTGRPPSIDLGSGNDGSTLAKAYTITLNTRTSAILVMSFEKTFKPAAAATGATFAIQAIDPVTGVDLPDAAEVFNTKFRPATLFFQAEAVTSHPSFPGQTLNSGNIGNIINPGASIPINTKIPASNAGHLAYKITITPKPGSAYDGPKAHVFVKIAIPGVSGARVNCNTRANYS